MTLPFSVGDRVEVRTGPVAHGGHVVARVRTAAEARDVVVFVRHALPDETVLVEITEVDRSFLRGNAIEVLEASGDRVSAPCPLAHPGGCGGCDFQHVALPAQRRLKADVVSEQLRRLAGVEREVVVEEVPPSLRWRTRMQYVGLPDGRRGLRKHRSHEVVEVDDCLIAAPDARTTVVDEGGRRRRGVVEEGGLRGRAVVEEGGLRRRAVVEEGGLRPSRNPRAASTVTEHVLGHDFRVDVDGFWQVHPEAPRVLVETVLGMLEPRPGERAVDLYAGVGLFSVFLAEAVGAAGGVVSVEGDRRASELAGENLAPYPQASVRPGRVDHVLVSGLGSRRPVDLVVLDPPRDGARRKVVTEVSRLSPRAVAYVACDPAALARDLAYFREAGYALADLRAFDLFPMTHHVECVALLVPVQRR